MMVLLSWPPTLPGWSDLAFNEENSWLIIPMICGAMVVTGVVMGLLLDYLPRLKLPDTTLSVVFVGGVILATVGTVAIIMTVAITRLGCCD